MNLLLTCMGSLSCIISFGILVMAWSLEGKCSVSTVELLNSLLIESYWTQLVKWIRKITLTRFYTDSGLKKLFLFVYTLRKPFIYLYLYRSNLLNRLIIKITISSIVIGLRKLLFSTNSLVKLLSNSLLSDSLLSDSSISRSHSKL